jgi:hypothetical protein
VIKNDKTVSSLEKKEEEQIKSAITAILIEIEGTMKSNPLFKELEATMGEIKHED